MAKFITRTIQSSKIIVGELKLGSTDVEAIGSITEDKVVGQEEALKIVQSAFKGRNVLVLDIEVSEPTKYRMNIQDFIANAEKVESEEVVQEEADLEIPA